MSDMCNNTSSSYLIRKITTRKISSFFINILTRRKEWGKRIGKWGSKKWCPHSDHLTYFEFSVFLKCLKRYQSAKTVAEKSYISTNSIHRTNLFNFTSKYICWMSNRSSIKVRKLWNIYYICLLWNMSSEKTHISIFTNKSRHHHINWRLSSMI